MVLTKVSQRLDLLGHRQTLLIIDHRPLWFPPIFLIIFLLLPQIALQRYQDELHPGAILRDLAHPFTFHVLERVGRVNAEAEHDGVGIIVG